MIQIAMPKRGLVVAGLAVAGAQAGHLLAYQLRFGADAFQVQSSGVHAYFPALLKTSLGAAALMLICALLIVSAASLLSQGRGLRRTSGPSFISLLAALFTAQLAWYIGQEVAETLVAGVVPDSASTLVLWGMVGQLPVALAGAAALRWLWTRVEEAASELASVARAALPVPAPAPVAVLAIHDSERAVLLAHAARATAVKRGPPFSS